MKYNFEDLKKQVQENLNEHSRHQTWDSILYNSSIIIAITASSSATFLFDSCPLTAKILSAIAAIVIAIDRSLHWGERWVFQRQMRYEYLSILSRISLVENSGFSEDKKKKYFLLIFDDLFALYKRESIIPGTTGIKSKQ